MNGELSKITTVMPDLNKRTHYNNNGVETKTIIKALSQQAEGGEITLYQGFCIGNIIKYLTRFYRDDRPLEDLTKARVYIDYLIETVTKSDVVSSVDTSNTTVVSGE